MTMYYTAACCCIHRIARSRSTDAAGVGPPPLGRRSASAGVRARAPCVRASPDRGLIAPTATRSDRCTRHGMQKAEGAAGRSAIGYTKQRATWISSSIMECAASPRPSHEPRTRRRRHSKRGEAVEALTTQPMRTRRPRTTPTARRAKRPAQPIWSLTVLISSSAFAFTVSTTLYSDSRVLALSAAISALEPTSVRACAPTSSLRRAR